MSENSMSKDELEAEIKRLSPFLHDVELPFALRTYVADHARRDVERTRLATIINHAWEPLLEVFGGSLKGKRVLDVACNCGGFSIEAARHGASYVLGIDVVDRYLEQAAFIKRALSMSQVEFKKLSADDVAESTIGGFDVTLCLGILYHLENPVDVMKKLSSVTRRAMLVDTTILRRPFTRKATWEMTIAGGATMDSRDATTSLWRPTDVIQFTPSIRAVTALLEFLGFSQVVRLRPNRNVEERSYFRGTRAAFLALRDEC